MALFKRIEEFWVDGLRSSVARFSWVIASTFVALVTAWLLINQDNDKSRDFSILAKVLAISLLGIPLFYAIRLFSESQAKYNRFYLPGSLIATALLVGYYFTLPGDLEELPIFQGFRYLAIALGAHALVSFCVYRSLDQIHLFWQFNVQQFLRFIIGVFYSTILMAGISLAFAAFDFLLGISVEVENYGRLAIFLFIGFNTLFFLNGQHTQLQGQEEIAPYPKGLSIFSRFILIPLVLLYLFILYAYVLKISLAWSLPNGYLTLMVMCYSVLGILAYLFVFPLRNDSGQDWIQKFIKWFFVLLLPLLVVLFIAIGTRISDYGWTEERYAVAALGLWLLIMALYFLISRKDNIVVIPVSLAIISLISVVGPWSMFSVSQRSQKSELSALLEPTKMMDDGKLMLLKDSTDRVMNDTMYERTYSIIAYLGDHYGWDSFSESMDTVRFNKLNGVSKLSSVYQVMSYYQWERRGYDTKEDLQVSIQTSDAFDRPTDIQGFAKMNHFNAYQAESFVGSDL
ncbi:MAG: DUF4153 domain-containing protein, partial [Saprospiraceae bacterium]